jgi:diaminopimelate epimerase
MQLHFYKFQGTGNDFIIVDNFHQQAPEISRKQMIHLCHRRFSIGADGIIFLNKVNGYDFGMEYYNADGRESTMCGNGGRCLVKFAHLTGIHKTEYNFMAIDGPHQAEIEMSGDVRLKMKEVNKIEYHHSYAVLNTGSPHFVKFATHVEEIDVLATGSDIRNSSAFAAEGINVNFVETIDEDSIFVRTYERGVEDETLSCGTGVTAAALLCAHNENGFNTVNVRTKGGLLRVEFDKYSDQYFNNIWLCGPAEMVFKGEVKL